MKLRYLVASNKLEVFSFVVEVLVTSNKIEVETLVTSNKIEVFSDVQ